MAKGEGPATMPFWLHESRATLLFKGMPQGYKLSFTLFLSLLPLLIWLVIWYIPTQRALATLDHEMVVQEHSIKELQKIVPNYKQALVQHDELQRKLNAQVYATASLQEVVDALLACMHQSSVVCRGVQQHESLVKEFFTQHRLVIECKGTFGNLLAFVEYSQQLPLPLSYESLIFNEAKQQLVYGRLIVCVHLLHERRGNSLTIPGFHGSPDYITLRNPFEMGTQDKSHRPNDIVLEGIVTSGKEHYAALMSCGSERDIVSKGDRFCGYRLVTIDKKYVVVMKGTVTKKLMIE